MAFKKITQKKAFTLIELLIATAIFTVVIASVYSAFHSGLFGYRNINEAIGIYQSARLILERMDRDLRNAFVYSAEETKFKGAENEISFLTLVDTYKNNRLNREYAFVSYALDEEKLLRLCRRNQEVLNEDSEEKPQEVSGNISKLSFSYFEYDEDSEDKDELKETSEWNQPQKLPAAVKVTLAIRGEKTQEQFERTIFLR